MIKDIYNQLVEQSVSRKEVEAVTESDGALFVNSRLDDDIRVN